MEIIDKILLTNPGLFLCALTCILVFFKTVESIISIGEKIDKKCAADKDLCDVCSKRFDCGKA